MKLSEDKKKKILEALQWQATKKLENIEVLPGDTVVIRFKTKITTSIDKEDVIKER